MIFFGLSLAAVAGLVSAYRALTRSPDPARNVIRHPRWRRLAAFLARAGVRGQAAPGAFIALSLGTAAAGGLASYLLLDWTLPALVGALVGALAPGLYFERRGRRKRGELQAALVDAIGQLRASLGGGQSVQQALAALARTGPASLRPDFADLARDLPRHGVVPALRRMQARLADPLFDTFASALIINDRIGGRQIGPVLEQLARAACAELLLQEESRAQQASTVLQARIIAALPWGLLVLIRQANPVYLAPFDSIEGQLLLLACGAVTVVAYRAMLWLGRLPGEGRVPQ